MLNEIMEWIADDNKPYENSYESDYGNDNRYDSYEPEYTDNAYNSL